MSLSSRVFSALIGVSAVALLGDLSPPAMAQPVGMRTPQFVVTAVSFKALDETGADFLGSDEVLAVFSDLDPAHGDLMTSIYGDVDAGETHNFKPTETCIAPHPKCDRGLPSVHFKIALWENDDTGFLHGELTGDHNRLENGGYWGDDLIGKKEVTVPTADLIQALPHVGDSKDFTIKPTGGAGVYEFTYRITRLANAIHVPPIGPPVSIDISLQATPTVTGVGGRVRLDWTGASTSTVDIYRDNTKIVTTPNDGLYVDPVPLGTYQFRVCDLNSTRCSPNVGVTVG